MTREHTRNHEVTDFRVLVDGGFVQGSLVEHLVAEHNFRHVDLMMLPELEHQRIHNLEHGHGVADWRIAKNALPVECCSDPWLGPLCHNNGFWLTVICHNCQSTVAEYTTKNDDRPAVTLVG